ncbi:CrcB family protein [endosymbiont of Acanthamoeba sp. UWC8]|uniref:fluoride efflux transporter CrcB n=1 Tax=endosymbiont of Acanthamoeba sp. UWC8 TaxID=86106 RepID=UPI0004D0B903|nr:fluoride efflux transporter CrcB [endosymbiont of Acanthamoeba sp. UWC8]AIF80640.1 CrcB family protein [endosymbiont of Acanthamoeba sp. UWC8]
MNLYLLVFIGCGMGGMLRYLTTLKINSFFGSYYPLGTLSVNIIGSFIIGLLFTVISNKFSANNEAADQLKALLITGFLGGYTTFSSFSIETINLLKAGELFVALLYITCSVVFCIGFACLGTVIGERL